MVFVCVFNSRDRSRERHKATNSKDSSRSERSVVINPPDTPSQESPVHNGEPLPGEPTLAADHGDDAQVVSMELFIGVTQNRTRKCDVLTVKECGLFFRE